MANNWSYEGFQKWFCDKFKKPNPLPWQDAMQAIIDYITNEIPDNMQVVLNKLTSGQSSASLTGNGTPDNPFILTINLSMVDFKGDKGDKGDPGATGPKGDTGAGVGTVDQIELTSVSSMTYDTTNGWTVVYNAVIDYGDGDTHVTTATARLPIKPGDNVTIDISEDGKSLVIKASGGGAIYKHHLTINGYGNDFYADFYSSKNLKCDSLTDLKTLLGATFQLPTSGAISSGALGSGYYLALYLDENALNVADANSVKTISYSVIILSDTVTTI